VDKGQGQIEPASHPTRIGPDPPIDGVPDVHQTENFGDPLPELARGEPEQPSLESEELPAGLEIIEGGLLS